MAGGKIRKEKPKASSSHFQGGISFFKSRGQHILKNPKVVEAIVDKAGIKSTDVILEIGPGTGNLTKKLLEAGKSVIAFEVDPRMVLGLRRRFQGTPFSNRLEIRQGDVLKVKELPYFDLCVANIPYQISSPLVTKLLNHEEHKGGFRCAIIMFQKEFATRLVAQPGDHEYCRLSVNTQLKARVNHLLRVGKNNFRPPPKVDSSVVRIEPRRPLPIPREKLEEWDGLRICFSRRNKTLGSIFRQKNQLAMLEKNYKTPQSSGVDVEKDVDEMSSDDDDDDDDEMDVEDVDMDEESNESDFKTKVLGVLKEYDYEDKRSSKLTQNEFIHLLSVFNEAGIHLPVITNGQDQVKTTLDDN